MKKGVFFFLLVIGLVLTFHSPTRVLSISEEIVNYTVAEIPFNFMNINETGINTDLSGDDVSINIPIGFNFPFYQEIQNNITISSNGFLVFGFEGTTPENLNIPNISEPNNLIAPFWDDLNLKIGGSIFYELSGISPDRKLIIQWDNIPHFLFTPLGSTFQTKLFENGIIEFHYFNTNFSNPFFDFGASATIGVENIDGSEGTQYSHNEAIIFEGLGLSFIPLICPINNLPILEPIGNQEVIENETLMINLNATDPDGDTLVFGTNAGSVLPSNFTFNPLNGNFEWTPIIIPSPSHNRLESRVVLVVIISPHEI